ncbi:MAG: HlyD family type I secretion periplasmic adaptor subunit [Halioglobus sp.]
MKASYTQFMPAALEVTETPASPLGRWVLWLTLLFFMLVIAWACLGSVDIVVSAQGRIIPSGRVKSVQAREVATVSAIYVAEGEEVKAGQRLLSLDPTYSDADLELLNQRMVQLTTEQRWRRALLDWLGGDTFTLADPLAARTREVTDMQVSQLIFEQQKAEINATFSQIEQDRDAMASAAGGVVAEEAKLEALLPIVSDRLQAHRALYEKQFGAKVSYLEVLQQHTDLQLTRPILQQRRQELNHQLASAQSRLASARQEYIRSNLLRWVELQTETSQTSQKLRKARLDRRQRDLVAPLDGTVEQLAIHTIGAVVTPAQTLLSIVPYDADIEVEVNFQNRDIGFLRQGQIAEVKVETFNFTKYGLLSAEIVDISEDAVKDERLGWVYPARLKLASRTLTIDDVDIDLMAGLTVTAEVKTGKRRLIEFFLSPLMRYRHESIRER